MALAFGVGQDLKAGIVVAPDTNIYGLAAKHGPAIKPGLSVPPLSTKRNTTPSRYPPTRAACTLIRTTARLPISLWPKCPSLSALLRSN